MVHTQEGSAEINQEESLKFYLIYQTNKQKMVKNWKLQLSEHRTKMQLSLRFTLQQIQSSAWTDNASEWGLCSDEKQRKSYILRSDHFETKFTVESFIKKNYLRFH